MPVEWNTMISFLVAVSVVVMSPGPDTMLILRHTLSSGTRVGLATVAGVQFGLLGHNLLAIVGISMIIVSSPLLFRCVAMVGALYLGWLGVGSLRAAATVGVGRDPERVSAGRGFRDAFFTNILNPKVIVLFLALLPNFVDTSRDNVATQLSVLTAGLIVINTLWQAPLALLGKVARDWLERPTVQRTVHRVAGIMLLLFAGFMLYENVLQLP